MRHTLQKALALISAVMILCTLLPLSILTTNAATKNLIKNGNFENITSTAWTTAKGTVLSMDAAYNGLCGLHLVGDGSYDALAYQDFPTTIGKSYLVTAMMMADSNGVNVQVKSGSAKLAATWFKQTAWTDISLQFTATSSTTRLNFSGAGNGMEESVYLDDVVVIELQEPSFDGYLYNGDFEAGSLVKWNAYQNTALSTSAAYTGNGGVRIYGKADWGALLEQDITLDAGKTYRVSFRYKVLSNGVNFSIKYGNEKLLYKWLNDKSTSWKYYEATFESTTATKVKVSFTGSGLADTTAGAGTKDELYVDDILIENLSGDEIDRNPLLDDRGISIRDTADGTRGLAFQFHMTANGVQTTGQYKEYVDGTGKLNLYKYDDAIGNLVKFGAIVTNSPTVGKGDFTHSDVNGKKVVDIPAKYLMEANDTAVDFAVRIVDIPDYGTNSVIYARPYYTYELDGKQVTVYGDVQSDSYAHVSNIRRSLKVLAIGNSFSVDAMKNHLYDVLRSAEYDQIILGNLYIGGCSLNTHWENIRLNQAAYQYQKNDDDGQWVYTESTTPLTALQDENWDVITIQQVSSDSGVAGSYGNLDEIVNWVHTNKTNPDAKVMWHMTWAYQQDSNHEAFPKYNRDQMTMYNAILNCVQNRVLTVDGIDGVIPSGTAIQNLRTSDLGDTLTSDGYHLKDSYGDYTAALTWFRALTGESLDLVTYRPATIQNYHYDIAQAVAHAVYNPYQVTDLSETVILGLSDFQASNDAKGQQQVKDILDGALANRYGLFDGLFAVGDYSAAIGYDVALTGIQALDQTIDPYVSHGKIYTEGNHDAPDLPDLAPDGNNDPAGGKFGVYVINEEVYDQYGNGGEAAAKGMKAYFEEKLADESWGNKPIFVLCHVPLHYSMRTETSSSGKTAMPMVDVLNEAGSKGLNILFLFGHNHSGAYDDYLGGASVYLKKGDTMMVPTYGSNYRVPKTVSIHFTYLNVGYVGYNKDNGYGADVALTVTTFRIRKDGSVIISRWDEDGLHNLKSKGVKNTVLMDTWSPNTTVYESSRIVTADDDRKYEE